MRGGATLRTAVMSIAAFTAWTAVALQTWITVPVLLAKGYSVPGAVAHVLGYFTVLTNALAAVSLSAALLQPRGALGRRAALPNVATGIALSMVMIGAIYSLFLRKLWPAAGLQHTADICLRYVGPLSYALYWALAVPRFDPRLRALGQWLVFPACYAIVMLVRSGLGAAVPYFFLDVGSWGLARVLLNCSWFAAGFLVVGLVLIGLDRVKPRT